MERTGLGVFLLALIAVAVASVMLKFAGEDEAEVVEPAGPDPRAPLEKVVNAFNAQPPSPDRLELVRQTEGLASKIATHLERFPQGHQLRLGGVLGARPSPAGNPRLFALGRIDGRAVRFLFEEVEPERWVIDWESAVGFCQTDWAEFVEKAPAGSHHMRVAVAGGDYFKGEFPGDRGLLCVKLQDLHGRASCWGYVAADTEIGRGLGARIDSGGAITVTLALEFPPADPDKPDAARDQVWIREIVSGSWFVE